MQILPPFSCEFSALKNPAGFQSTKTVYARPSLLLVNSFLGVRGKREKFFRGGNEWCSLRSQLLLCPIGQLLLGKGGAGEVKKPRCGERRGFGNTRSVSQNALSGSCSCSQSLKSSPSSFSSRKSITSFNCLSL